MGRLGKEIKKYRLRLGLKGKDLAKKVGIDPTYITYIEKHNKLPSPKVMKKIASVLDNPQGLLDLYVSEKYPDVKDLLGIK